MAAVEVFSHDGVEWQWRFKGEPWGAGVPYPSREEAVKSASRHGDVTVVHERSASLTIEFGTNHTDDRPVVLDAGSGPGSGAGEWFPVEQFRIMRLDADPGAAPDVVGDIRSIPLGNECVDAVWCSHTLEHLPERDLPTALAEFHRVLKPGGRLIVRVPDLKAVAREIAADKLGDTIYESPAGPVRPLDVVFGFQPYVEQQPLYEHKTGFTARVLGEALGAAGFAGDVHELPAAFELVAVTYKPPGVFRDDDARNGHFAAR